uniref:3'-5' exonuclease n=1 Tax=Gilvibacter sp. TaxID=2729997 RepID=UPI003F4A70DE
MYLIFDTETTGLPKRWDAPVSDSDNWPRAIQIAWQLHDAMGNLIEQKDYLINPEGFNIPFEAESIHGISTELATADGVSLDQVLEEFNDVLARSQFVVGQNVGFDLNIMGAEFYRRSVDTSLLSLPVLDTCTETTAELCKIPGGRGGKFKLPTLTELHEHLFGDGFAEAHNATADVEATTRCFLELLRQGIYSTTELKAQPDYIEEFKKVNQSPIQVIGLQHVNLKEASAKLRAQKQEEQTSISTEEQNQNISALAEVPFAHLHNHSQFSVLQSTASIQDLVNAAAKHEMNAVALTDRGNMMGAFHFVSAVEKFNKSLEEDQQDKKIKPIIGCEFFVCEDRLNKSQKDNGYQVVFLAKNKAGYHNLAKMASIAYTEGFYYVPRIDKAVVQQYKDDLIVLTGNLYGEVPNKLLNVGEKQAEEALLWWKQEFPNDLYVEVVRHGQEDEDRVNPDLIALARKHDLPLVACNDTYYIDQEDANAHDILLCVKDGEKQATPIGRGRGYRYGLPNQEYFFKDAEAMKSLFADLPEAIENVAKIVDQIEPYTLAREVLLPKFDIPEQFQVTEDDTDGGKRGEN